MGYQIDIEFEPIYEMVASLSVYINQKSNYDLDKKWFQRIDERVPTAFKAMMKQTDILQCLGYLLIVIRESPQKESLTDFIAWFEQLSIGELYELIYPYLTEEMPKDLPTFKDYYVKMLTMWEQTYSIDKPILSYLEQFTKDLKTKQHQFSPIDLVEQCTNGIRLEPMEGIEHLILVPSCHMMPLNRIYGFKHSFFVHFPVDLPTVDSTMPSVGLLRRTKALGDEKRLRILQILAQEPKTFTEIGERMGLSKSNLHYHLTMLRSAGLIRITNFMFRQPDRYEVRPNAFDLHKQELEDYVYKKSAERVANNN